MALFQRNDLQPREVHIWFAKLDLSLNRLPQYERYLSAEERARAERVRLLPARHAFIQARAILRLLLASYCADSPEHLRLSVDAYGKPMLHVNSAQSPLYFNLSHTQGLALYAFTHLCELGVDIEYMRPDLAYEQMAERFFSRPEIAALRDLPEQRRAEGFFNAWTRKEAYLKARGKGLSLPLSLFDVSLHPDQPAALLETREPDQLAAAWSLHNLAAPAGYKAALALPSRDFSLRCWHWDR